MLFGEEMVHPEAILFTESRDTSLIEGDVHIFVILGFERGRYLPINNVLLLPLIVVDDIDSAILLICLPCL